MNSTNNNIRRPLLILGTHVLVLILGARVLVFIQPYLCKFDCLGSNPGLNYL